MFHLYIHPHTLIHTKTHTHNRMGREEREKKKERRKEEKEKKRKKEGKGHEPPRDRKERQLPAPTEEPLGQSLGSKLFRVGLRAQAVLYI